MSDPIIKYQLIMFDLDGTLTPSKSALSQRMSEALVRLLARKKVAIISGGTYSQFDNQFIKYLPATSTSFSNLYLLPVSGSCMYIWRGFWELQYAENLSPSEKMTIGKALDLALKESGYLGLMKVYGDTVEDRGSQITFSALGQRAPLELKATWDPDRTKRGDIVKILAPKIPDFDVAIGGMTSIDITRHGVNKAYGIKKMEEYLRIGPDKIMFVGDAIYEGGNDYPAVSAGVDHRQVSGPDETLKLIDSWIV